ncbi:MAG: sulfurtransferase TusA family protein [Dermatophilaceae bacterium]
MATQSGRSAGGVPTDMNPIADVGRLADPIEPADELTPADTWDAGDMGCGELIIQLRGRVRALQPGQILELFAIDSGALEDIPAWCRLTGHGLAHAAHPRYLIRRKEG